MTQRALPPAVSDQYDKAAARAAAAAAVDRNQVGVMTPYLEPQENDEWIETRNEIVRQAADMFGEFLDQIWENRMGQEPEADFFQRWETYDQGGHLVVPDPFNPGQYLIDPQTGLPVLAGWAQTYASTCGHLFWRQFRRYTNIKARKQRDTEAMQSQLMQMFTEATA